MSLKLISLGLVTSLIDDLLMEWSVDNNGYHEDGSRDTPKVTENIPRFVIPMCLSSERTLRCIQRIHSRFFG